ncbi:MAG TPA: replicative DNA helicase [Dictyoglomaceae bacterium]|nr:replicative DNA helicase [Dictyoglomaceae bacterium]HOL38957.1 replicative DNA helicase [Dictyoglomaceae bacterium]HOP94855.1 replicative DNA helicase [Dictyoglomaceae bacterium]HPP15626.1 replicative DNA helicase [Dictyoglomaceae bacterium]HPU43507.1 replicative DNA helicase [Dictyoglomaceae bacterium]
MKKEDILGKIPPHNEEAEQAVLGAMLLSRDAIAKVVEILHPDSFYYEHHGMIFRVIVDLFEKALPVDLVSVTEELRNRNILEKVGGSVYVASLLDVVPTAANVEYYAHIVAEKALLRKLINAGTEIVSLGYKENETPELLVDKAEQLIFEIAQYHRFRALVPLREILSKSFKEIEKLHQTGKPYTGVPTGFWDLDRKTGGLQPSDLIIIAARPGMGKTSFSLSIAQYIALEEHLPVAIFNLEMSSFQLALRLLGSEAQIDIHRLRTGQIKEQEWPKLARAFGKLAEAPIYVDDTPDLNVVEMRARARRLKAEKGLALIIVDYLQLIRFLDRDKSENQQISEISRGLKSLARELEVPVIAISQLSRAVEARAERRPQLSDLRGSGGLEQDADVVIFIYREGYYKAQEMEIDSDTPEEVEIIIAKQRNGPTGTVKLLFFKSSTSFKSLSLRDER